MTCIMANYQADVPILRDIWKKNRLNDVLKQTTNSAIQTISTKLSDTDCPAVKCLKYLTCMKFVNLRLTMAPGWVNPPAGRISAGMPLWCFHQFPLLIFIFPLQWQHILYIQKLYCMGNMYYDTQILPHLTIALPFIFPLKWAAHFIKVLQLQHIL